MSRFPGKQRACCVRYLTVTILACGLAAACADTKNSASREPTLRERTSEAFADDMPSVSGGEGDRLDREGIKRDWDRFWNP